MKIPDPVEIMDARIERLASDFIDEFTCMQCGVRHDYEMICPNPMGVGPIVCCDCLGFDPFEVIDKQEQKRLESEDQAV